MAGITRWIDRWIFREGGRYNCALARIAIAVALLLTIFHNGNFTQMVSSWDSWLEGVSAAGWYPKGLVKIGSLFWAGPPPYLLTAVVFIVSVVAIVMMLVGLLTFPAQIVATIGTTYIVSLQTSFGAYWSHAYNVQLLAAAAFMFSRSSADVLSVDASIRWLMRQPQRSNEGHYWWPVIFAELATTMFMASAFFQKFRETGVFWALSDNIRNSLGATWYQYRTDPPELAMYIASSPLIWQMAGLLQLFAQATTILAAFLVARPVFRAIFGALFFFIEILALTHVFRFWHPFWVPLCFLSIDWEHFYRQMRERRTEYPSWGSGYLRPLGFLFQRRLESQPATPAPSISKLPVGRAVMAFGLVFFGYYAANVYLRLGERHLNYPFSSMAFYSETRAHKPYSEHHYWPLWTGRIDAYDAGSTSPVALWYREGHLEDQLFRVRTIDQLKAIDAAYRARASRGLYQTPTESGQAYRLAPVIPKRIVYRSGLMAVPPYPQPLGMVDVHMAIRAVRDDRGFRAVVARVEKNPNGPASISLIHEGFSNPTFEILMARGDNGGRTIPTVSPLKGEWRENKFFIGEEFDEKYLVARVIDASQGIDEIYYAGNIF